MRKVKIVCTLGPACANLEMLDSLLHAGMNVTRFNFSHGDYETHGKMLGMVREVEKKNGVPIATLLDTKGPEIRTGLLVGHEPVRLYQGDMFDLLIHDQEGTNEGVYVTYDRLTEEIEVGQDLYIDDGSIHLVVESIEEDRLRCRIVVGGILGERKGVNFPGATLSVPTLTEKDIADIRWGIEHQMDYIAVSFVRTRDDIIQVRRVLEDLGGNLKVIAKIETRQSVDNLESIVQVVDGVMVARGDLGVEMATEEVPMAQKRIIDLCRSQGKPVIVATQMLDSMIRNPRPTRAEASDVANAVLDGADAVMLSGETANGKYPLETVTTMVRIVSRTEEGDQRWCRVPDMPIGTSVADSVSHAAVTMASEVKAKAILSLTRSGSTARMVSKYRPQADILATTPLVSTCRELTLVWGVQSILLEESSTTDKAIDSAIAVVEAKGFVNAGDTLVITTGFPVFVAGTTNMVLVQTIGRILVKGHALVKREAVGFICNANTPAEAAEKMEQGKVLVVPCTNDECLSAMKKASAVITEERGITNHAALACLNLDIPCMTGVADATKLLKDGTLVTVDGMRGVVHEGRVRIS